MLSSLKTASLLLCVLLLLTGVLYPAFITLIAQTFFSDKANGSLVQNAQGQVIGSHLIGQFVNQKTYFWSRPSATVEKPYNAQISSGSNLGPSNPKLLEIVKQRVTQLHILDSNNPQLIPIDLVTASASGLDPDISVQAAFYQVPRIARLRHLRVNQVNDLVRQYSQPRQWYFFGEPRVNVLAINLALDQLGANEQ